MNFGRCFAIILVTLAMFPASSVADWIELTNDDFEVGWGNYTDGGAACFLHEGTVYPHQPDRCANIEDDKDDLSSFYLTNSLDIRTYVGIKVEFWFKASSMEETEVFKLQYSSDNGSTWEDVKVYVRAVDFENGPFYFESVEISNSAVSFTEFAKIKFTCDASTSDDDIYIDEIVIYGDTGVDLSPPLPNPSTFATVPTAAGLNSVTMTATTATDISTPVEYYFSETTSNPGGDNSGWQTSTTYVDDGLSPATRYTYTVHTRDSLNNIGDPSGPASATTYTTVPDVLDQVRANAQATITAAGLVVGSTTETYNNTIQIGSVISQSIAGGSIVPADTIVNLTISRGTLLIDMDDLQELARYWMDFCGNCGYANWNTDTTVDYDDFASVAFNWLTDTNIPLVINELMASNDTTISDENDEFEDWIEIYNYGNSNISLGGMYLNDSSNTWQIPAGVSINAGQYLIFWADDEVSEGLTHTNYKLSAGGDEIYLYDTDGTTLIDSITFDDQDTDISYGRFEDAEDNWYSMSSPTPGATNSAGMSGRVYFSKLSGTFTDNFDLILSTSSSTAEIRYTTDATIPTASSTLYTGAIPITNTGAKRVWAKSFEPGLAPGPLEYHQYIPLNSDVTAFTSNLPIVIIDSFGTTIDVSYCIDRAYPDQPVAAVFIDVDDQTGVAKITDVPQYAGRAGMHVRGRTSSCWPKKQFKLELWTETDFEDKKASLLGLPSESDWMLHAPYHDKTLIRNALTYNWSNDMGLYALRSRPVELFFTETGGKITLDGLNGGNTDYRGVYMLMERIKIGNDRVDIASLETVDNAEPEVSGGYLLKVDKFEAGDEGKGEPGTVDSGHFDTNLDLLGLALQYDDPSFYVVTGSQRNWIEDWIDEFETVLTSASFDNPVNGYAKYADVESFIEYDILCELFKSLDGYKFSVYMNKDRNGKMAMGPIFDFNYSSGNTSDPENCWISTEVMAQRGGWYKQLNASWAAGWFNEMARDPEFVLACADKWFSHRKDVLSDTKIDADIEYLGALLNANGAAARNFTRWNVLNTRLWCNPYYGTASVPHTHEMEIQWLKNWFTGNGTEDPSEPTYDSDYADRLGWIDTHWGPDRDIPAPPQMYINSAASDDAYVTSGDELTFTTEEGNVYYTTDGTDPRIAGGTINPTAILYETGTATIVTETIVSEGSLWRYLDDGSNQGTAWYGTSFVDSSWSEGPAELGYGDGDEATVVSYGPDENNKYITTYFRRTFNVADASIYDSLDIEVVRDDGVVVYLNGVEVGRDNMPEGAVDYLTVAPTYPPEGEWTDLGSVDPALLVDGNNILAVEIHQNGVTSSDISFDLRLTGDTGSIGGASPPIVLTKTTRIEARAKNGNKWGAVNKVNFAMSPVAENLRITEIMYHPEDPNDEFIELKNIGPGSINIYRAKLTDGVNFTFPDITLATGEYVVVVRNEESFMLKYPSFSGIIAGVYTDDSGGVLSNGGEEIVLKDAIGTEIMDFDYNDSWYPITDGKGFSLCVVDEDPLNPAVWDSKAGWQASSVKGGSPGTDNPANLVANGDVVINEILTHTDDPVYGDWIELHNTTSAPIDIGGWYLSDDFDNLKKYKIAVGTTIPANGYKVFTSVANFRNPNDSGSYVQFGLSELGEDVYLSSGSGSELSGGCSLVEEFDAELIDVSIGRYVKSTGGVDFVAMSYMTRGSVNSLPAVPAVVINEIMYNALDVEDSIGEYIELYNRSGSTVYLYDLSNPSNTWKFTKGIEYTFPPGTAIPAGGYLLVTRTMPEIFELHYSVPGGVQVFGPFENNTELDNGGEKIELSLPGVPEPITNFVPYIRVEQVNYSDGSHPSTTDPWPVSADAGGNSLSRISASSYSNDVSNWQSSSPSPGSTN